MANLPLALLLLPLILSIFPPSTFHKLLSCIMRRQDSIGLRVSKRKRGFFAATSKQGNDGSSLSKSRRKLITVTEHYTDNDIEIIKQVYGHYQHHGTGNPLALRAPSSPKGFAVSNLANIIQDGHVGRLPSSDSTPKLKTERGASGSSFWTSRLRLAGSYGWTGLVLEENAKSNQPLPIQEVKYFLVESEEEINALQESLEQTHWSQVKERVITVSQLAEQARHETAN